MATAYLAHDVKHHRKQAWKLIPSSDCEGFFGTMKKRDVPAISLGSESL